MSQLTLLLTQNGIPEQAAAWLFLLPLIITIAVIGRQIVGIKGLGISTPLLIGFALTATGLQAGVMIFMLILITALLIKAILRKIRLLYLPKMALMISGAVATVILATPLLPYKNDLEFPQATLALIIIILAMEQFVALIIERGTRKTFKIAFETLSISVLVFLLATWDYLYNLALTYPFFILLGAILINAFLGKWTGLRVSEYIRFKDIIFK